MRLVFALDTIFLDPVIKVDICQLQLAILFEEYTLLDFRHWLDISDF